MTAGAPRVLIIIPPETFRRPIPQLGSLYIAAALKQRNIPCAILDCKVADINFNDLKKYKLQYRSITHPIQWEILKEKIIQWKPDIVGITALTPEIKNGAKLARIVKEYRSGVPVLIGGVHASSLPRETLTEFPEYDILIKGEVDHVISDFAELWSKGGDGWKTLPGVVYRQNGEIHENPVFPKVENMDSLPFPARELAPMAEYQKFLEFSKYLGDADASGIMMTSRGCPSRCTFCTSPGIRGRVFRAQSPERVLSEMAFVRGNYGAKVFLMWDDIFTVDKKRVHEICDQIIARRWDISFTCFSKVGQIDFPLLQKMKQAGCTIINYGIETGSESVMRSIKKGITLENTLKTVRQTVEAGIKPSAGFILGHPADTPETIKETIRYTVKLANAGLEHIGFWIATPYPGTEMFQKEYANISTLDWDSYIHTGLDEQGASLVYLPKDMTAKQILGFQRKAYRTFNRALLLKKLFKGEVKPFLKALWQKIRNSLLWGAQKILKPSDASATFPQA